MHSLSCRFPAAARRCIGLLILGGILLILSARVLHARDNGAGHRTFRLSSGLPGITGLLAAPGDRPVTYADVKSRRIPSSGIEEKKIFGAKILLAASVAVTVYSIIRMEEEWGECDRYEALSARADNYSDAMEYYGQAREFYKSGRRCRSVVLAGAFSGGLIRYFMWRRLGYGMSDRNVIGF